MPARDEQQQIGEFEVRIAQPRRQRMAFEMVDRDQRLARRQRQRLAGDEAHHHPADQPGSRGGGDRVDLRQRHPRLGQRGLDQRRQHLDMRARRDLGHDAAIGPVRRFLARQPVREHGAVARHQRGGGLVAARFEAEDQCHASPLPVRSAKL